MRRKRKQNPELTMIVREENGEPVIYIEHEGVRIAKRGKPGTPYYKQWIPLQLGWVIRDHNYPHGIEVVEFPGMASVQ
jgi:hypothetical protein